MVEVESDVCLIPPNSFALALSVERFRIPKNVMTICVGKSTYARCGIVVNVTPFEPGWEGRAVLEISNTTPLPAKIYANEGLAQVLEGQGVVVAKVETGNAIVPIIDLGPEQIIERFTRSALSAEPS